MSNTIDANVIEKQEKSETQNLTTIHIGVFFDGTNNNMVRLASYEKSKMKLRLWRKDVGESKKIQKIRDEIKKVKVIIGVLSAKRALNNDEETENEINKKKQYLKKLNDELERLQCEFNVSEKQFDEDMTKHSGESTYSNVAILYTLFNPFSPNDTGEMSTNIHENEKQKKFYIEGSGATDISCEISGNINGLGFGLGNTGVTALVSKAVRHVTNYLNSLSNGITENTIVKFYVFGFSRGSTCARLFCHLLTRESGTNIVRESEFKDFLDDTYFTETGDGAKHLSFLETGAGANKTKLTRENVIIEYLGIYDTVASIGFLKQKDGWSNPLGKPYIGSNYRDNWHYKNVYEYGLYISPKIKHVCHIGALDEFRENFAFTNIGSKVPSNAIEILIPGCHSDVGGGYTTGSDQEISLHRFRPDNSKKASIPTYIPLKSYTKQTKQDSNSIIASEFENFIDDSDNIRYETIICNVSNISLAVEDFQPFSSDYAYISKNSMTHVGWIDPENKTRTLRVVEKDKTLLFKRHVLRGWSDVSLQMMINDCKKRELNIFTKNTCYNYTQTLKSDKDVLSIANSIIETQGFDYGKRYCYIPGGAFDSEYYKYLRLNYLHFTSTSSLYHTTISRHPLEGTPGNFGNPPNFDLDGMLCRLMYDGDNINPDTNPPKTKIKEKIMYDGDNINPDTNPPKTKIKEKIHGFVDKISLSVSKDKSNNGSQNSVDVSKGYVNFVKYIYELKFDHTIDPCAEAKKPPIQE